MCYPTVDLSLTEEDGREIDRQLHIDRLEASIAEALSKENRDQGQVAP